MQNEVLNIKKCSLLGHQVNSGHLQQENHSAVVLYAIKFKFSISSSWPSIPYLARPIT